MSDTDDHYPSGEKARNDARDALSPKAVAFSTGQWDRFVLFMRLAMPGLAVVLIAVTLLWPLLNDTEVSFTLSQEKVAKSDDQILMQNLVYVGTLNADRVFRLEAAEGRQNSPTTPRIALTDIRARMDIEDGVEAHVSAGQGVFHTQDDVLRVAETVTIETSNGYSLTMTGADVHLKEQRAVGYGPVNGTTPMGRLSAGRVEIIVKEAEGVFDGGVTLHIVPRRIREARQSQ